MVLVNKKTVNNADLGFHSGSDGKKSICDARDIRHGFNPWVGKILWRKEWHPQSPLSEFLEERFLRD